MRALFTSVFTNADAWSGGSYELALDIGPVDDERLERALRALWSFRDLDGCYRCRGLEPRDQPRLVLATGTFDLNERLHGLATLAGDRVVACSTIPVREDGGSDWLYFGLPLGSLRTAVEIGAFPFADGGKLAWRSDLDSWLRGLAAHVYESVRFGLALVGWTDGDTDTATTIAASGVPGERWVGYLVPEGAGLRWYPPNQHAPLAAGT